MDISCGCVLFADRTDLQNYLYMHIDTLHLIQLQRLSFTEQIAKL
jgi:hypothetical protein